MSAAPLAHLALIVRGADTARLDIAPEAAGLVALFLGLSRMFADDLEQLDAGMLIYDALYRWCRDATGKTHDCLANRTGRCRRRIFLTNLVSEPTPNEKGPQVRTQFLAPRLS